MLDRYVNQVRLLLGVLPDIASEEVFALKGGTAINLFYRDMPRLSVDIDLTYLPVGDRETSLRDIDKALDRIMTAIAMRSPRILAQRIAGGGNNDTRIMVSDGRARIKIETSPVTRGTVHPPTRMMASDAVIEQFGFTEMNVLAFEDLYGGKLHAALDRQHPRDLFDVKLLYDNEGLTDDLFRSFLKNTAEQAVFLFAQPPVLHLIGGLANIVDGVLLDNPVLHGISKNPTQQANGPGGSTWASSDNRPATSLCLDIRPRLPRRNIPQETGNIRRRYILHTACSQQRYNVPVNPAAVDNQG